MGRLALARADDLRVITSAATLVEVVHPRINRPALEWTLSRLVVEPVTESSTRHAAALLTHVSLHGHKCAIDAMLGATALAAPGTDRCAGRHRGAGASARLRRVPPADSHQQRNSASASRYPPGSRGRPARQSQFTPSTAQERSQGARRVPAPSTRPRAPGRLPVRLKRTPYRDGRPDRVSGKPQAADLAKRVRIRRPPEAVCAGWNPAGGTPKKLLTRRNTGREFCGRSVTESFRAGAWRVIALHTAAPGDRMPDLASTPAHDEIDHTTGLVWDLHPGYVLRPQDRVVLTTTRQGLAELLGRQPRLPARSSDLWSGPRRKSAAAPHECIHDMREPTHEDKQRASEARTAGLPSGLLRYRGCGHSGLLGSLGLTR